MKTILFDKNSSLEQAAEIIKNGGLVAFPTETVYGLGANALDASAAEKTYKAKGRPSDNPLIIHLASADDVEKYAYVNETFNEIAKLFMPGPITVVLPKKEIIPKTVTGGLDTVAVRIPSNEKESTNHKGCYSLFWPARRDSNPRSSESESAALSSCAMGRSLSKREEGIVKRC